MKITCIVSSHNKPDFCFKTLDSLIAQSHEDWQAIVMDSGTLYHDNYFKDYEQDPRFQIHQTYETQHDKNTKAMAPWSFNQALRRATGEIITYLCDDDIYYPHAFYTHNLYAQANPHALAWYASEDRARQVGNRFQVFAQINADVIGGRFANGRRMDQCVDYLQLAHRTTLLNRMQAPYWSESKATEDHADGVFMERIGLLTPIYPLDVIIAQNRRTTVSTYTPVLA